MLSLDIKVGTPKHEQLLKAVCDRKKFSKQKMDNFKQQWSDADDSLMAYIPTKEVDANRKNRKKMLGETDYVTLELPYVYAQIMTMHTYWSTVFLSRSPVWQYSARHGESQDSVMAVEAVMDYQLKVGNQLPVLYNWLYDLSRYSLGIIGLYWDEEEVVCSEVVEEPKTLLGMPLPGTKQRKVRQKIVKGYQGNRLYNVRPVDFFPDPRVPLNRFQDGEFAIRETSEGYSTIHAVDQQAPGYYCNVKELLAKMKKNETSTETERADNPRTELPLGPNEGNAPGVGFCKLSECYIKLVPKQWGLTESLRTETWCLTVADDEIVVGVKPMGLYHNKFPFSLVEGSFGADSFAKSGVLEMIRPLTDIMTWLVNSHFYNVRSAMNNTLILDPSRIVMKDLKVNTPGGRVRLKPEAYGTDPRTAVHQLTQVDLTRGHLTDIAFVEQITQRVSGVVDNIMGVQSSSSRKSATEARISSGWSTNRLKVPAEYNSALAFDPLAMMMLSNTQQLMSLETKFAVAGSTLETAQRFLDVNPSSIAGFYDFVPVDGTMPVDRLAQANFWKELLMQMARVPEIAMQWDMGAMMAHVMKMQGERNIDRFKIKIGSPEWLMKQQAAGNVVPIGGKGGQAGRAGGGGTPRGAGSSGGTV